MIALKNVVLIIAFIFVMTSCASQEEKARKIYNDSLVAQRAGNGIEYEKGLKTIVRKYGQTSTATDANRDLNVAASMHSKVHSNQGQLIAILFLVQDKFKEQNGKYASSVDELISSGLIEESLVRMKLTDTDERFDTTITIDGDSYFIVSTSNYPDEYRFYAKPGIGVRYEVGKAATSTSHQFAIKPF